MARQIWKTPKPKKPNNKTVSIRLPREIIHFYQQQAIANYRKFSEEIVRVLSQHKTIVELPKLND